MKKYIVVFTTVLSIWSCDNPNSNFVGSWKVSDYQNELLIEYPAAKQQLFEESVKMQKAKLVEFASYEFNQDGSYVMYFTPQDFDEGKWEILDDSLLIFNSSKYNTSDTSILHFEGSKSASIRMEDEAQRITVYISKK